MHTSSLRPYLAVSMAATLLTVTAAAQTRTETFDTGPGNFNLLVGNGANGNSFGFSSTNNTGLSPGGELGGTFARGTRLMAYAADSNIGTLSRNDLLQFAGEIFLTDEDFDGSLVLGFFNTAVSGSFLGFEIEEPSGSTAFRVSVRADGAQQAGRASSGTSNSPLTFSFTFTPSALNDGSGAYTGTFGAQNYTGTLPAGTTTFNAFGIGTGFVGSANSALNAQVFIDNLSYTAVPEPSVALSLMGGMAILGMLRRRRA